MSAAEILDPLANAVRSGRPLVLILGQDAWRQGAVADPLLTMALARAGRLDRGDGSASYGSLLGPTPLDPSFYDWLADQYQHQPDAAWLEKVAELPLNAVFTSSFVPTLSRAFRRRGREVQPVLSAEDTPDAPRQKRNLHITYLFGRAGEARASESPPRSNTERIQRAVMHASPLLARLTETATALGLVLIDGLTPGRDWLEDPMLFGILSSLPHKHVMWFGLTPTDAERSPLLAQLAYPVGPIVFVPDRLSASLSVLNDANRIDLSATQYVDVTDIVTVGTNTLEIEPGLRLKTATAAAIFDDGWLDDLPAVSDGQNYDEFRRFHGSAEDPRRLVAGVRRDYAITRTYEKSLHDRVSAALENIGDRESLVLVHGQSGTGKSIALARLAYEIRRGRKYPVLFASRATRLPAVDELEEFCIAAEEAGAEAILLICDANRTPRSYRNLLHGFQSRGRKVVVVGSTYRSAESASDVPDDPCLVEAPAELNDEELRALKSLFQERLGRPIELVGSPFLLTALYRMLPEVRPQLASGLAGEARDAEDRVRRRGVRKSKRPPPPAGILGIALQEAGLIDAKAVLEQTVEHFLGVANDTASRIINYVVVASKLQCTVPLTLVMRAVSDGASITDTLELFAGIDILRWSSNETDDILLHARSQIEADLLAAKRLGTAEAEAVVAIDLIKNASPASGSTEARFLLDLMQKIGPDGPFRKRYKQQYVALARALTANRKQKGFSVPGLMLQEATLRRSGVRDAAPMDMSEAELLDEARAIVDDALDKFCDGRNRGWKTACANLKVERASIYAFLATNAERSGKPDNEVLQFYRHAKESALKAIAATPTYHPVDVSLWLPDDLLNNKTGRVWHDSARAELMADMLDGLERVSVEQLDVDQQERYLRRRAEIGHTLNDQELEEAALQDLAEMGSLAGVYLQARRIGGDLHGTGTPSVEDLNRARAVMEFLDSQREPDLHDGRILRYMFRASWLLDTRTWLFARERSPLPESPAGRESLMRMLNTLAQLEGAFGDPRNVYLRAVLLWQSGGENEAREIWRQLALETQFNDPRRIIRHHIWTEGGGNARIFHGRITREALAHGRAHIAVEELRQQIEILQKDFPQQELRRGVNVHGGFGIAFNFIGPIAQPPSRLPGGAT